MNKLLSVKEIFGFRLGNRPMLNGSNGSRCGTMGLLSYLCGGGSYDGYEIKTENATYRILIENEQNCCESWGYFSSDDNFDDFIGKSLVDVSLTDTALNRKKLDDSGWYDGDEGGIQFVDFKFSDGSVLQFAVYNAHNGYYGHSIYVIKDDEIIHSDTL